MNENPDREEEILQDALRIPAGPERDAYLDEACGGDEEMRREIEELLVAAAKPASAIRNVGDLAAAANMSACALEDQESHEIFQIARELPEAQRAAYLEEMCQNAEQREHLERMLANDRFRMLADDWFLGSREDEGDTVVTIPEGPETVIGPYKLLEKIGEGAFGVVFMAEQRGDLPRRVALKIIKEGMDTREVIARFEAERRALALMEHSHIAKVFDAGATETGRPYFVMELVRGVPITQFCDQKKYTIRQRLALFMAVCDAVTHAHQKGIIHRDLKPSNILVGLDGEKPVPKVIDFGIAKATQQRLTEKTYFTSFKQFIGTFPYLCPEQSDLSTLDIDTRADIYALGVVLYELLAGKLPFDPKTFGKAGVEAMRRVVRDQEPLKPSTQLVTLQGKKRRTVEISHGADMDKLRRLIRGDLDWIVMKAMEKDRDRRYETANGLAMDIQRYLNTEAVVACPPSNVYRFQKLVRRNKTIFSAAALVGAVLIFGAGISTFMFIEERRAHIRALQAESLAEEARANEEKLRQEAESNEHQAHAAARKSEQIKRFLEDMLKGVGPSVALGRDTKMLRDILESTVRRVTTELADQAGIQAELLNTVGEVYIELGQFQQAEEILRKAMAIQGSLAETERLSLASLLHNLSRALAGLGQPAGAEEACRKALAIRKSKGRDDEEVAECLSTLGAIVHQRGRCGDAEPLLLRALEIRRKELSADDPALADSLRQVGGFLQNHGRPAEAEPLLRRALAIQEKLWGEDDLRMAELLRSLAANLESQGDLEQAETIRRDALKKTQRQFGFKHPKYAGALKELGSLLCRQKKQNEILELFRQEVIRAQARAPGFADFRFEPISSLMGVLLARAEMETAEQVVNEMLTPAIEAQPGNSALLYSRAEFLARRSLWGEAATDWARLAELEPEIQEFAYKLAPLLAEKGDWNEYERVCREMAARFGDTEDALLAEKTAKACSLISTNGELARTGGELADRALILGPKHPLVPYLELAKGLAEYRAGDVEKAEEWLKKVLSHRWADANLNAPTQLILAMIHQKNGKTAEAKAALEKGSTLILKSWPKASLGDLGPNWHDLLIARILLREAEGSMKDGSSQRADKTEDPVPTKCANRG